MHNHIFPFRSFPHISTVQPLFLSTHLRIAPVSISANISSGCVSMATDTEAGLWDVRECASSKAKFICRQNQNTSVSPELPVPQPTPSLSGSCPSDWKSNSNLRYCYKVQN